MYLQNKMVNALFSKTSARHHDCFIRSFTIASISYLLYVGKIDDITSLRLTSYTQAADFQNAASQRLSLSFSVIGKEKSNVIRGS